MSVRKIKLHSVGSSNGEPRKYRSKKEEGLVERLKAQSTQCPDVRKALVQRIREEIASGNYDDEKKLDIAVEEMLSEFYGD
jgi:anti-sigma28 factor (negative regulator of flagellin synthesis)